MVNDKQFYISRQEINQIHDWNTIPLLNGFFLHYQKKLKICNIEKSIFLIGDAWQVDPNKQDPLIELQKLSKKNNISQEDIYQIEKSWCGRYLLIVNDWIYLDTIGSIGLFYSEDFVSSSLNIICHLEKRTYINPNFEYRKLPDYFPGVLTPYDGIKRLMPSEIINYVNSEVINRPLIIDSSIQDLSHNDLIEKFSQVFIHSIKKLSQVFSDRKIWIALTAGRDSRVALSLFEKANINYSTFSLWHNNISIADKMIPPIIAKKLKKRHKFINRYDHHYSKKNHSDYLTHTYGMAQDADWLFYSYEQYQSLRERNNKIIIIRSGIWEIPQEFFKTKQKIETIENIFPNIRQKESQYKSMKEWFKMVQHDEVNKELPLESRISWDLSQGCWLSSIEQSFDLMEGIDSIQPFNCRLFVSLLSGFNYEDRIYKKCEEDLTKYNCPSIATIPYDYQYEPNLFVQIKYKINKIINNINSR